MTNWPEFLSEKMSCLINVRPNTKMPIAASVRIN
jgi:hypothetical protein